MSNLCNLPTKSKFPSSIIIYLFYIDPKIDGITAFVRRETRIPKFSLISIYAHCPTHSKKGFCLLTFWYTIKGTGEIPVFKGYVQFKMFSYPIMKVFPQNLDILYQSYLFYFTDPRQVALW